MRRGGRAEGFTTRLGAVLTLDAEVQPPVCEAASRKTVVSVWVPVVSGPSVTGYRIGVRSTGWWIASRTAAPVRHSSSLTYNHTYLHENHYNLANLSGMLL